MQGMALFKLRITSLSSHRDKQRFRIRVSPVDTSLLLREPHLTAVTTPMKCVTKLSHRGSGGNKEGEGEEARPAPPCPALPRPLCRLHALLHLAQPLHLRLPHPPVHAEVDHF